MNLDAREAALGLLSMGHPAASSSSPHYQHLHSGLHSQQQQQHQQQHPHQQHQHQHQQRRHDVDNRPTPTAATSSATLNSILTTTTPPPPPMTGRTSTIPAKRKQAEAEVEGDDGFGYGFGSGSGLRSPRPQAVARFDPPRSAAGPSHHQNNNNNNNTNNMIHTNSRHTNKGSPRPVPSSSSFLPPSAPAPQSSSAAIAVSPPPPAASADISSEAIDCMCGIALDDGFSIACDDCGRWCHAACFGITKDGPVPDVFHCAVCVPRGEGERERARRGAREWVLAGGGGVSGAGGQVGGIGGGIGVGIGMGGYRHGPASPLLVGEDGGREAKHRRKQSPGVDRKHRRPSAAASAAAGAFDGGGIVGSAGGGGGKRKQRRASVVQHSPLVGAHTHSPLAGSGALASGLSSAAYNHNHTSTSTSTSNGAGGAGNGTAEEHIEIDEPWKDAYVHITEDIVPSDETRAKLRRQAQHWRGVTAVSASPPPPAASSSSSSHPHPSSSSSASSSHQQHPHAPPATKITLLPPALAYNPLLLRISPTAPGVLPPLYALHTARPIAERAMIAPYPAVITSSADYLRDPLNGYAGMGVPRMGVHFVGGGGGKGKGKERGEDLDLDLDLALDARMVGGEARFARSGCRPNAVIRPRLCVDSRRAGAAAAACKSKAKDKDKENDINPNKDKDKGKAKAEDDDTDTDDDGTTLTFGVFATRDLRAGEEVVLGWEWDDGNAVHSLPALLSAPGTFS
ncbi:hypothetical protein CVT25_013393 [Psilocybe cyanescens]|uniref:PHD-type domain-containing protein n=1 Tax=Psilocybe cyanescens TaxID=93625 RepID=A0A409WT10_PSICY|nr:hypothetical protein CVT25_013393 [Psilocybe cyanescens]